MKEIVDQEIKIETPKPSSPLEVLQKELESVKEPECKLQKVIDCMELSIAQSGSPNFRCFWDARKICIELFKEQVNPSVRSILWAKYCELSKEAYRLKEILDEESAFAMEQIDIAIKGVESEITRMKENFDEIEKFELPNNCGAIKNNRLKFQEFQREIALLNTLATRITSLRKELIHTQMRIKQKNKFFKRLSSIGDDIFPRRKELIKTISELFISDVDVFVGKYFGEGSAGAPLFQLRDEIKGMQGVAKLLTLNSHAFSHSRKKLSECWDKLKELDKERKKDRMEQREEFQKNAAEILVKIQAFAEEVKEDKLSSGECDKQVDQLLKEMRDIKLGREEVQHLRDQIRKAQEPILAKKKVEEEKRLELQREKERERNAKMEKVKDAVTELENLKSVKEFEVYDAKIAAVEKEIKECGFSSAEKKKQLQRLVPIKDQIEEKKEEALLALPDDKKEALRQLKSVWAQKKERRKIVKDQLEAMRKSAGSSGLDFEQSLNMNEQINNEKLRLEKMDLSIEEVNAQITALKKG